MSLGVVAKELKEDVEDALLLLGSEDIGSSLGPQPGPFYRQSDKHKSPKGNVAV